MKYHTSLTTVLPVSVVFAALPASISLYLGPLQPIYGTAPLSCVNASSITLLLYAVLGQPLVCWEPVVIPNRGLEEVDNILVLLVF